MKSTEDLARQVNRGGNVVVNRDCYEITEAVAVPSNTLIDLNGSVIVGRSWKLKAHDQFGLFNLLDSQNVRITNGMIFGVQGAKHMETPKQIYCKDASNVEIDHCVFLRQGAEGIWGSVSGCTVHHCTFWQIGRGEWPALPACQPVGPSCHFYENTIVDCGSGFGPSDVGTLLENNVVLDCDLSGIGVGDTREVPEGPATVRNNFVFSESNARCAGIMLTGSGFAAPVELLENTSVAAGRAMAVEITQGADTQANHNLFAVSGEGVAVSGHGRDDRDITFQSTENSYRSIDGGGRGIVMTPSSPRVINVRSKDDNAEGFGESQIVMDVSEYRGGRVAACVSDFSCSSGYFRRRDGVMVPADATNGWSYP